MAEFPEAPFEKSCSSGPEVPFAMHLPSGYLTVCHGKSPFLIGKPSINGPFSMAMLDNQRLNMSLKHQLLHVRAFTD